MERFGDAPSIRRLLRELSARQGTSVQLLLWLRSLPPTDAVRDRLVAAREAAARLAADADELDRARAWRTVTDLEQRLELCQRRDEIAATRPPGCWCLGAGGEGTRGIPAAGRAMDGAEPFETFVRYCTCEEGAAAERAALAAQHAHERWVIDSRRRRIWGQARVPSIYDGLTLESWVEEVDRRGGSREDAETLIRKLRRWLDTTDSLALIGPPSAGKTGLAVALMWELAGRGIGVHFANCSDMVMRIKGTFDRPDQSEVEMFDALAEVPVLVLDDLGKQAMTPYARELFYRLFNARCGHARPRPGRAARRTIVTSNLSRVDQLRAHLDEAVYDRLMEVSKVAPVDPGVNLRAPRRAGAALP